MESYSCALTPHFPLRGNHYYPPRDILCVCVCLAQCLCVCVTLAQSCLTLCNLTVTQGHSMCMCVTHSVVSDSLQYHGLYAYTRINTYHQGNISVYVCLCVCISTPLVLHQ